MAKNKMCTYSGPVKTVDVPKEKRPPWNIMSWHGHRPHGVKRIRVKCPVCGRRMWSSVSQCHDGCCITHSIPPHKVKMWWKKGRK